MQSGGNGPGIAVALSGLPPLYCHGLIAAMSAAGMSCHRPRTPEDWDRVLALSQGLVLVAATTHAVEVAGRLAGRERPVPVVHVLDDLSTSTCSEALRSGATGLVAVDAQLALAVAVIRAAASGHTLLPRQQAEQLCGVFAARGPELSERERDWLADLADSATVASLARRSGHSEREMYRLLGALYARLGAANRTDALLLAQRYGLLERRAELAAR